MLPACLARDNGLPKVEKLDADNARRVGGNTLAILGIAAFAIKIFLFIFVIMWIRWTIPRFRFDQLMHLGWKSLLPLSLINLLVTGLVIAFKNGWF